MELFPQKKEKRWADRLREMTESIKGGLEFDETEGRHMKEGYKLKHLIV